MFPGLSSEKLWKGIKKIWTIVCDYTADKNVYNTGTTITSKH